MLRIEQIARRVAATEVVAASFVFAKERPPDLFAGTFFDIRVKAKGIKQKMEDEAVAHLTSALTQDLNGSGANVVSLKISMGQYRGSRFITSAKLTAVTGTQAKAEQLLTHLQTKYSPKYKLKNFNAETGEADYNVR